MDFFIADEHLGHKKIIKYCDRPFRNVEHMDDEIIKRNNEVVTNDDTVYHIGDFTLRTTQEALEYIDKLNGKHIFIKGSHDYWLKRPHGVIIEQSIQKQKMVLCHYPMESWRWSYHGSWHLHGHWHYAGNTRRNRINVCADLNDFYPFSFTQISEMISEQENPEN